MPAETATRISSVFARAKAKGRKAFIAYLTGGDPTPSYTTPLVLALERGGADIIELGVPFSDPIADGPVVQRASERALRAGTTVPLLLETVQEIRLHSQIPIVLFSYLNPLLRYGFEKLARRASDSGIDGVLLTDLSVEEAEQPVRVLRASGLDTIFLAAPTSTERRLRLVAAHSSGFIYLVSRTGVTGERASLSEAARPLVERMRGLTDLPLAIGFGISSPAQVFEAGTLADGVVVGSSIVNCIERESASADFISKLENFVRGLSAPLKGT
jgi:tryptophan synthase alpha chain